MSIKLNFEGLDLAALSQDQTVGQKTTMNVGQKAVYAVLGLFSQHASKLPTGGWVATDTIVKALKDSTDDDGKAFDEARVTAALNVLKSERAENMSHDDGGATGNYRIGVAQATRAGGAGKGKPFHYYNIDADAEFPSNSEGHPYMCAVK